MNVMNYGKCGNLSAIWEFSKRFDKICQFQTYNKLPASCLHCIEYTFHPVKITCRMLHEDKFLRGCNNSFDLVLDTLFTIHLIAIYPGPFTQQPFGMTSGSLFHKPFTFIPVVTMEPDVTGIDYVPFI